MRRLVFEPAMKTALVPIARPRALRNVLFGILPLVLAAQLLGWLAFFPSAIRGHADFRQLYTAGYMIRSGYGRELYDYGVQKRFQDALVSHEELALPFIRPAYQALLFAPLSFLSYRTAYFVFLLINVSLLAFCFRLLHASVGTLASACSLLPFALVFGFLPVAVALMQGQDSIILLTLLVAAFYSLDRGREFTAGFWVGLGMFKFQIVIPVAVLLLAWRRWRFVVGFALSAAVVSAGSISLVGVGQTMQFARSLLSVGAGLGSGQIKFPLRVTLMANVRGLVSGVAATRLPALWLQIATLALSAALLILAATLAPKKLRGSDVLLPAITTAVLVSYYLFIHDLSVMLIPVLVILDRFINAQATRDVWGWLAGIGGTLVFGAPICVYVIPDAFYLIAVLLLNFLVVVTMALRRQSADINHRGTVRGATAGA